MRIISKLSPNTLPAFTQGPGEVIGVIIGMVESFPGAGTAYGGFEYVSTNQHVEPITSRTLHIPSEAHCDEYMNASRATPMEIGFCVIVALNGKAHFKRFQPS